MKNKTTLLLLLFICLSSYSQHENNQLNISNGSFIKLSLYKKIFHKDLTKKEFSSLKFSKGDTLVFVERLQEILEKASKHNNASIVHKKMVYMSLEDYKKKYKKIITKADSLNFQFKDNDTLILINNKDFYKNQKGVSVLYQLKDSTFLEIYKDLVYKKYNSYGNIREGRKEFMRLWQTPLKIYFSPSLNNYYKRKIKQAVKKIAYIDSLKISFVKNQKESNYIIYQIDDKNKIEYSDNLKNNKQVDYYIYWNKGRIYDTKLKINLTKNNKNSKKTNGNILVQNFYQTLGRFFTTNKVPHTSIFSSSNSNDKKLTKLDLELLNYHYSYGICKFTSLDVFEENHRKAKEVIRKGGVMKFTHIN
ncbi:MAG: hypothetical protein ACI9Z4_000988 [Polaribacter sp.]|jgi:hypothetical protein